MTDTYTIEQIREAYEITVDGRATISVDRLIAALQPSAWVPADGELYLYRTTTGGIDIWEHTEGDVIRPGAHPQSLAMHGPAVKALRSTSMRLHDAVLTIPTDCFDEMAALADAIKAFDEAVR